MSITLTTAAAKLAKWFERYKVTPGNYNYRLNYYGVHHAGRRGAFTSEMAELIRYGY